ncbi:hypothetical protein TNCV_3203861 [Trichonephila clavipes]|nr:hypothetical protein TNCV_3203861 [Trichonephila clavipes]
MAEFGSCALKLQNHSLTLSIVCNCFKLFKLVYIHNILAPVRVLNFRFEPTVPLVETHPVIYFMRCHIRFTSSPDTVCRTPPPRAIGPIVPVLKCLNLFKLWLSRVWQGRLT